MISADSAGSNIIGVTHAESPSESTDKVQIDESIITNNGIELINKLTTVVVDATVIDILHEDEHGDRVRAAGVDPSTFRH